MNNPVKAFFYHGVEIYICLGLLISNDANNSFSVKYISGSVCERVAAGIHNQS